MVATAKLDKDLDYQALCDNIRLSRREEEHRRREYRNAVSQDAGPHYTASAINQRQPVNIISLYRRIVGRSLISKNPRFTLSTHERSLLSMTEAIQDWGNKQVERMGLVDVLREAVTDSMYYVGIVKVCLADASASMMSGWEVRPGEPCAWVISQDDFVYDQRSKKLGGGGFVGHRYRAPRSAILSDKSLSAERKDLPASTELHFNEQGDERTSRLARSYYDTAEFEKMVDLWEIYLPRHRLVVTLQSDDAGHPCLSSDGKPLRVQPWVGPYCGPFHFLFLGNVPENAMGKGPILDLIDMNEAINDDWCKLIDQMRRQKSVVAANRMKGEDADRLRDTPDGGVFLHDGDPPTPMDWGGPSPANYNLAEAMTKLVSWLAGNLDMLGGLSPQSKTASQDKMLAQSASGAVQDFQEAVVTFTASVVRSLCWYWCKHPNKVMKSPYSPAGTPEIKVTRTVTPEMRLGLDFDDLDIQVDPYSLQHKAPAERVEMILKIVKEIYAPLAALAQQQGVFLDMNALFNLVGSMLDEPRMKEILQSMEPPADATNQGGAGTPETPGMPASTNRTYTRRSMGGEQSQGSATNRMQNSMSQMAATKNGAASGNGKPMY